MRRTAWLAAALALLLLGAWLSSLAEAHRPARARPPVAFPTALRLAEYERMEARRTLAVPAVAPAPVAAAVPEELEPPARRDPFLAALPAGADDPVLVFEANALRHSRLGELFVECVLARDPRAFEELRDEIGIDVLKDVDRVAFAGESVVVSGFLERFDRERLRQLFGGGPERIGEAGLLWAAPASGGGDVAIGTWGDQILVLSSDPARVRRAIDQLEGRAEPAGIELPDDIAYGEAYGIIPGDALRRILHDNPDLLADRLAAAARRVELHVDAMQDLAAVARFHGDDASAMSDLARAMGGVLAGARLHAQATGDRVLADLLDQASVVPGQGSFSVQVALPVERVESWFERCRR